MIYHCFLVILGGFCGAISRYLISTWVNKRFCTKIPYGTLLVNLSGSLLLGLVIGSGANSTVTLLLGTGFLGAFTTFSTLKLESFKLSQRNQWGALCLYLGLSYTLGILIAFAGIQIAA